MRMTPSGVCRSTYRACLGLSFCLRPEYCKGRHYCTSRGIENENLSSLWRFRMSDRRRQLALKKHQWCTEKGATSFAPPITSREYRSSGRNLGQHIQSVDGRGHSEAGPFSILDSHH